MKKISSLLTVVEDILVLDSKFRDDDKKLCIKVWLNILNKEGHDHNLLSTKDFFKLYLNGILPNHDSITRARRKLQEENPLLRGASYTYKQKKQKEVLKDLGYNV